MIGILLIRLPRYVIPSVAMLVFIWKQELSSLSTLSMIINQLANDLETVNANSRQAYNCPPSQMHDADIKMMHAA